jgi:hypothetical protein
MTLWMRVTYAAFLALTFGLATVSVIIVITQ